MLAAQTQGIAPSGSALFRAPFLRNSLGIWVTSFMGLLLVYALNTWLPTLMIEAGYGLQRGLWFLLLMNVGAIVGLLVAGQVGVAIGLRTAVIIWFLASAILLAALSVKVQVGLLYPLVFVTGCFVFSAQVLVYAYTAANHPPAVRATALGMAAGIGRLAHYSTEERHKLEVRELLEPLLEHDFRTVMNAISGLEALGDSKAIVALEKCAAGALDGRIKRRAQNAASAIREGAFIGTPSVNVGSRQTARQRGDNVIDAAYDRVAIAAAIMDRIKIGRLPSNPIYGDGKAGPRIAHLLSTEDFDINKVITY